MSHASRPLIFLPVALLAACADNAVDGPCAALLDTCIASQQACDEIDGTASCVDCPAGQYASHSGRCEAIGGTPLAHDFPEVTLDPGAEKNALCQSWTLDNATELWVSAVELEQNAASHHSDWFFVPNTVYDGTDGQWRCTRRGFDQLKAALAGGVLYAQSTQTVHEVQRFPNGAAVRIPPWSRVVGNVHFLNASPAAVTGHYHLVIYTTPVEQVQVKLVPFHLQFIALDIPAHARSRWYADCAAGDEFYTATKEPWDMQVYYLLPHAHATSRRFFLQHLGGPHDGQPLLDLAAYDGESHGRAYDPPVRMGDAAGFRFGCEYDNQRDQNIQYGIGDQEMCEVLGFGSSALSFDSVVADSSLVGNEGALQLFAGRCATLTFNWDFQKAGGTPP